MTFEIIGWGAYSSFLGPQLIGVSLKDLKSLDLSTKDGDL